MTSSKKATVGVYETPTAVRKTIIKDTMIINEKNTAPTVYVLTKRDPSGFWPLHINQCPYCAGEHWHGGGTGDQPLLGHRAAHCVVRTPGYTLEVLA